MSTRYRYDRRLPKHRKKHLSIIVVTSLVVLAMVGIASYWFISNSLKNQNNSDISGPAQSAGQVLADSTLTSNQTINEPFFTMSLPYDWHQISNVDTPAQHSITWQSSIDDSNRWLTIYIDTIPSTFAVNRLLPLTSQGSTLSYGTLSDNCANFTATNGVVAPVNPIQARWDGVNFWCDIPSRNDNKVGTGSVGTINSTKLTGPTTGSHNYFFVYIDRNAEPDYTIFYAALNSFRAK